MINSSVVDGGDGSSKPVSTNNLNDSPMLKSEQIDYVISRLRANDRQLTLDQHDLLSRDSMAASGNAAAIICFLATDQALAGGNCP